jgi:hypothetical protein
MNGVPQQWRNEPPTRPAPEERGTVRIDFPKPVTVFPKLVVAFQKPVAARTFCDRFSATWSRFSVSLSWFWKNRDQLSRNWSQPTLTCDQFPKNHDHAGAKWSWISENLSHFSKIRS